MAGPFSIRQTCDIESRDLVIEVMDGKYPCGLIIDGEFYPECFHRKMSPEELQHLADTVAAHSWTEEYKRKLRTIRKSGYRS